METTIEGIRLRIYDAGGDLKLGWYVEASKTTKDGVTHRRQFKKGINRFNTAKARKEAARKLMDSLVVLIRNGELVPFPGQAPNRLIDAMRNALDQVRNTHRPATLSIYTSAVNRFEKWLQATGRTGILIGDFGHFEADQYWKSLRLDHGLTNTSRNTYRAQLGNVLAMVCPENPFKGTKNLREQRKRHEAFDPEDLAVIMRALEDHPALRTFCKMEYYCAIRRTELTRLRVKDLQIERGLIRIPAEAAKGSNGSDSFVRIPATFLDELAEMIEGQPGGYFLFGSIGRRFGVSPTPSRPLSWTRAFRRILERLKLENKGYSLYSFKHTAACQLIDNGTELFHIMKHFRHSKPETTAKYLRSLGQLPPSEVVDKIRKI